MSDVVESDSVESLMAVNVETVEPKRSLKHALQKMVKRNIGSIVVVEGEKPVGIVTERDISRYVAKRTNALKTQVRNVMSSPLITIARSATNQEAMAAMLKHGIRRLPVVEKGKLVGIVSQRDLLRWVFRITYEKEPHITAEIRAILERPPFSKT
ncbi:MAG: CBS domain-containing protein [Candidatus Bathyarchaeia archaeon]